jgi:hypothetical protein
MLFMLALGPNMGASAVVIIRFAPIRSSIGGGTAPIALIMPAIAAVQRRIVSIMGCTVRLMEGAASSWSEPGASWLASRPSSGVRGTYPKVCGTYPKVCV